MPGVFIMVHLSNNIKLSFTICSSFVTTNSSSRQESIQDLTQSKKTRGVHSASCHLHRLIPLYPVIDLLAMSHRSPLSGWWQCARNAGISHMRCVEGYRRF